MSERIWTDEQLSAINERKKTLLVSAAAGSGKTATLTERIIRSLTDTENPVDITSLLIVTFTKAAASELGVKIRRALEEAVERDPENKELMRQLYLLPTAKIRTIDAFCADILRSNTDVCGISPVYRLADKAEEELLATTIMDGMIDSIYNGELTDIATAEEFEGLADCLTESKRAEELSEVFRLIYSGCESEVDGVDSLLSLIENLSPDGFTTVEDSLYGGIIMTRVREFCRHSLNVYAKYERELASGTEVEAKYLPVIDQDRALLLSVLNSETYTKMRDRMLTEEAFVSLPRIMKGKTPLMEEFVEERTDIKNDFVKEYRTYFLYDEAAWRRLFAEMYPKLCIFHRFLSYFDRVFFEEKKHRSIFSYADIARLAYGCLVKDGKTTDIAESMRREFSAIYIDEYQDVNSLQNSLFAAISREDNRFMVGDIKQSIYVFRKAKPEIFASMKKAFPPIKEATGSCAGVFMSKNFRSDRGIIDFVNGIFDRMFGLMGESIGYRSDDRLECGKTGEGGEPPYRRPEVCIVDKNGALSEAQVVAAKIKDLLENGTLDNGEPIKPSDIAILLRAPAGKDAAYAAALSELGIASRVSAREDFFLTPEVLLTLSVLNSIDNPRRDIYLAGYMCSPLCGFTADDLYLIKREAKGVALYDALVSYVEEHPDYERGRAFLKTLNYYRTIAEGVGVDTLLYKIYHETGLYSLAARNNGKENLTILYDYARSYEAGSFRGLYNFIHFINNITSKRDTEFDDKREGECRDAVIIMSAHASKGLEFPVVFVADMGRRFSDRDSKERLVYSDEVGLAFRLRTPSGLVVCDNPVRDIINLYNFDKTYEEELRIFYVALTRAREQLYLVGKSPLDDTERFVERCRRTRESLDSYSARRLSSYLEITLCASEGGGYLKTEEFVKLQAAAEEAKEEIAADGTTVEEAPDRELCRELSRRFNFVYPEPYLCELPEKLSVSRTSPTVLDGADESAVVLFEAEDESRLTLPRFIESDGAEESAKRGIATHYLLQFCDLENLAERGAEAELSRLAEGGYISAADRSRVRVSEIELFRSSELFARMRRAKSLYRELRFTLKLPADELTSDEERRRAFAGKEVLVQGVIDCIVEDESGELYLCDYKTDRLTKEELADKALARDTLRARHGVQLSYYERAVKEIFGRAPLATEVYSLHLGDTVDVRLPRR